MYGDVYIYECGLPEHLVPFGYALRVIHCERLLKDVLGGHVALVTFHVQWVRERDGSKPYILNIRLDWIDEDEARERIRSKIPLYKYASFQEFSEAFMSANPSASKFTASISWYSRHTGSDNALDRTEAEIERNGFGEGKEPAEPGFAFGTTWKPVVVSNSKFKTA